MILRLRREAAADVDVVRDLMDAAFRALPPAGSHREPDADVLDIEYVGVQEGEVEQIAEDELAAEAILVDALRADPAFEARLTLVAEVDGVVVGQLTASRGALVSPHGAPDLPLVGLGPLAVDPGFQRRGVGSALLHAVIGAAEALDEPALVLLGEPDFYARFGFEPAAPAGILAPDDGWGDAFQVRTLGSHVPTMVGRYRYAPPFDDL
ncbi:GNAT family N-acetyltransferase [Nakamurella flava]|uniref:GNAT family N-acetyltransferase n=1 Tax=Nakamurella flava TaxID=2576308 RepID=UPI00197B7FB3|nr:N-acetyltransferase [Nakamurella flava]